MNETVSFTGSVVADTQPTSAVAPLNGLRLLREHAWTNPLGKDTA
ncbi:hypothetical protein OG585_44150 [Streptomyces sp. NBC_01340]|nr:hypothetical protein OG585_44150 [Streptomyces sp. NBC_01340]